MVRHALVTFPFYALALLAGAAQAATIQYQVIDLPDVVGDPDRWQYSYHVSGSFEDGGGFNIVFDPALFADLQDPPPDVADWLVFTVPPDTFLPADGLYTATAATAGADLSLPFVLDVVWLGTGMPGAQAFEVFDAGFQILETGFTQPVPLPGALLLLGSAAVTLSGTARRRRQADK